MENKSHTYKYKYTRDDDLRVYYKMNGYLYCIGYNMRDEWSLWSCGKDGEPSCELKITTNDFFELPKGKDWTDMEVKKFLEQSYGLIL